MALPANQVSTIKASGGHYTSLAAWETDLDSANLDKDYTGEIEGEVTGAGEFSGINGGDGSPDPYKVIIKAKAGFEANGKNESTCAKNSGYLVIGGTPTDAVRYEISGIEISDGIYGVQLTNPHIDCELMVTKCVLRDIGNAGFSLAPSGSNDMPVRLGCNLLINCGGAVSVYGGIILNVAILTTKVEVFNNTVYHDSSDPICYGINERFGTFADFRNNAVCYYDNGGIDYGSTPSNVTYCAGSGDGTIPAGTGNIDTLRDDNTDWVDTSIFDFSLVSGSVLIAAGQEITESWFTTACVTDMAGNAWADTPSIGCFEVMATAVVTGTAITGGVTESEIVTGGETIIITLTDDTWVATVGADNAITTALIAGIDSAQSEAAGWDAIVKTNMTHADVVRTSDTVVTITLGAEVTYAITANETITITIPATALTVSGDVIVSTPTFDVTNEADGVKILGLIIAKLNNLLVASVLDL